MAREHEEIIDGLVDLFEKHGVQCLVQVGAEDGYEAHKIQKAINCRAIAIEGHPENMPVSKDLEFYHQVIGATDGMMVWYQHEHKDLSGHFQRGDGKDSVVAAKHSRLDSLCHDIGVEPDALIIDTEGSTMEVLEGATGILDGVRVIYAEVQQKEIRPGIRTVEAVDEFLSARGFSASREHPAYDAGPQENVIWVRK